MHSLVRTIIVVVVVVAPCMAWQGVRLRELLIEGASLDAFGPRLRSRAWKTVLGLLGSTAASSPTALSPLEQLEKFEHAQLRRYEGLCRQFSRRYEANRKRCLAQQRKGVADFARRKRNGNGDGAGERSDGSPQHSSSSSNGSGTDDDDDDDGGGHEGMAATLRQIAVDLRRARKDFPAECLPSLQRLL